MRFFQHHYAGRTRLYREHIVSRRISSSFRRYRRSCTFWCFLSKNRLGNIRNRFHHNMNNSRCFRMNDRKPKLHLWYYRMNSLKSNQERIWHSIFHRFSCNKGYCYLGDKCRSGRVGTPGHKLDIWCRRNRRNAECRCKARSVSRPGRWWYCLRIWWCGCRCIL